MKKIAIFTVTALTSTMIISAPLSVNAAASGQYCSSNQTGSKIVYYGGQSKEQIQEFLNQYGVNLEDYLNGCQPSGNGCGGLKNGSCGNSQDCLPGGCGSNCTNGNNCSGTNQPETSIPGTEAPETNAPETSAPETEVPETNAPETSAPETEVPETNASETNAPETNQPETNQPETSAPETEKPSEAETSYAEQVVNLVNEERTKRGLNPVVLDQKIASAAYVRAKEIVQSFSHTRPGGKAFSTVLDEMNVNYRGAGENIAWGQTSPEKVMEAWMNSDGHRANILNEKYTKIGVGYYQSNGRNYWTQLFTY